MKPRTLKTPQDVKEEFLRTGTSSAEWARVHGFDPATVNQVINGRNAGTRGVGHKIAVLLGLKDGVILSQEDEPTQKG